MPRLRSINSLAARIVLAKLLIALLTTAIVTPVYAQYTTATGMPTFTTAIPLEMGFTNVANGNLHLEIPLASFPQRGSLQYNARLIYDSLIWKIAGNAWQPTNVPNSMGGWRFVTGGEAGTVTYITGRSACDTPPPIKYRTFYDAFTWTAPDGTSHTFPIYTMQDNTICQEGVASDSELAEDSSGYTMSVTNYTSATVYAPDGTQVYPTVMDTNGNFFSKDANGNIIDTLQRTPITVTTNGNTTTYGILNPQGTRTNVTVTTTTLSTNTSFGQPGVTESQANITAIQSIAFADGTSYSFTYDTGTTSGHFGTLTGMTLLTGGAISYGYTTFADGMGNRSRWLASKTVGTNAWTFTPLAQSQTAQQVTVGDCTGDSIVYLFLLNNGAWVNSATYIDATRGTLITVSNAWDTSIACPLTGGCSGSAFVRRLSSTTTFPSGLHKAVTYSYSSAAAGQLSEIDESDYSADTPPILRKTLFSYAPLINTLSKPSQVIVKDGTNNIISQTNYFYDQTTPSATTGVPQHGTSSSSRGNLTTLSRWLNTTNSNLSTTITYDDTGNKLTVKDPGNHQTTFSYLDNFNDGINRNSLAYATQVTLPDTSSPTLAHHITRMQYEPNTGLPTKSTDQNGKDTTYTYDSFLRPLTVNLPDGGQTSFSYPTITQTEVRNKIDGSRSTYATSILDSLGRLSRNAIANGEAVQYDIQDFCYDANARVSFQSYTYQSNSLTGASVCSGSGDSFAYDALGRPTQLTHSDGTSIQTSYTARARQITDEGNGSFNVSRILQNDGLDRLTGVCEVSNTTLLGNGGTPGTCGLDIAATGFLTTYGYDLLDNLTTVTQGSVTARAFTYDSLSRMTSESQPEWGSGSVTNYGYNGDSLLISRSRPAPNQSNPAVVVTTNYGYDEDHRLRTRTYTLDPSGTPSATFNYDESSVWSNTLGNTFGRLSSESSGSTGQVFSYDAMGRVLNNWQCTPRTCGGVPYLLSYGYDLAGDMISAGNGAGVIFSYAYNTAPRLATVTSSLVDTQHPATLLSNAHYGSFGLISDSLGNGINESVGYNARGMLQSYTSTPSVYSFTLNGLAGNGTITAGNDSVNGNWTYAYDQFNRLASSSKSTAPAQAFTYDYDRYGNRWHQNVTQGSGPAPQYSIENTTNRISGSGVTYDALGNALTDGLGNTYTYDAENRLKTVVNSAVTYNYTYDADGRRIKNASTEFVYDLASKAISLFDGTTGTWNYGEIYAGGRHLGTYSNSTTTFIHSDWVGTKRAVTNLAGTTSQTCTNLPFGDGATCTGTTSSQYGFTDDLHDSESNLENTWFRQLSTTQGRWTRPDPYLGSIDIANPQSLNRYPYVGNDPMNFLDPFGLNRVTLLVVGNCLVEQTIGFANAADERAGIESVTAFEILFCEPSAPRSGGGGGSSLQSSLTPRNPCPEGGGAPDPSVYQQRGQAASSNEIKDIRNLLQFRRGGDLDAQVGHGPNGKVFGGSPAYANYAYGVYMSAAGYTLGQALVLADTYAQYRSRYPRNTPMAGPNYPFTPQVNVTNIANGFIAQQNGNLCHKPI